VSPLQTAARYILRLAKSSTCSCCGSRWANSATCAIVCSLCAVCLTVVGGVLQLTVGSVLLSAAGHGCTAAGQCSAGLPVQVLALTAGRRWRRWCSSHSLEVGRQLWCSRQAHEPSRCGPGIVQCQQAGNCGWQASPAHHNVIWCLLAPNTDAQAGLYVAATASCCEHQQAYVSSSCCVCCCQ
jgi:hypothetical protein